MIVLLYLHDDIHVVSKFDFVSFALQKIPFQLIPLISIKTLNMYNVKCSLLLNFLVDNQHFGISKIVMMHFLFQLSIKKYSEIINCTYIFVWQLRCVFPILQIFILISWQHFKWHQQGSAYFFFFICQINLCENIICEKSLTPVIK